MADQRPAIAILIMALYQLTFYKKANEIPLEFRVRFGKMKSNAGDCAVMGMIAQIVEDSKKSEADATSSQREVDGNIVGQ